MIPFVLQYDPDVDDVGKLKQLFNVTKAVMKSRHEQVEEAMDEMEKEAKVTKKKGRQMYNIRDLRIKYFTTSTKQ